MFTSPELLAARGGLLALAVRPAYSDRAVKSPSINVTNEPQTLYELFVQVGLQAGIDRSAEVSGKIKSGEVRFPKGVFRFKTNEEADAWKSRILTGRPFEKIARSTTTP